jgi:hypothetical protein
MNEIRLVLKQASGRLLMVDLLRTLTVCMAAAVGGLIVALLAQRIFGVQIRFPGDWLRLAGVLAMAAALAALVWSLVRRARGIALARELDERADLNESLSTAMWASAKAADDPWAHAVIETARDRATRVDVRRAIPITAPRLWPLPFAMALSLAILWFSVPAFDLLGLMEQRQTVAQTEQAVITATSESRDATEKVLEKLRQAGLDMKDDAAQEGAEQQAPKDPDQIRAQAIKRLTNMAEKLSEMQQGEKAQQMQALKDMMKQLRQPGPGPLDQLSRSLARGDFKKAQEELGELSKQLASDSLTEEQKQQLQQQLQKLQEQMQQLAQAKQDLEKQLEQAGMNKEQAQKAARDPEALKKALEELSNLSDEQKQQLMEKALAQMKAAEQCQSMGECLSQMAAGMSKDGMSQDGMEGMEGLSGQLSMMEMAQMEMESLGAASEEAMRQLAKLSGKMGKPGNCSGGDCEGGECEGGSCNNPWSAGLTQGRMGGGSGGPGQGMGASPDEIDSPVSIDRVRSASKQTQGPIIGTRLVYGEQVKGESSAEFIQAVEASRKAATEAISGNEVPRELQPAVKHYFGRMEERAKKR